jgi:hypothetical protein
MDDADGAWSVEAARKAAERDELREWVASFLASPGSDAVDDDYWRDDVEEMAEKIDDDDWEPPPVIVSYRDDQYVLEDGNHRVEGLRRAGKDHAWAIVGFDDPAARDRFVARIPS